MRASNVVLLLVAALTNAVSGAVRWELRDPNALRRFPHSNATTAATTNTITTSSKTSSLASFTTTQLGSPHGGTTTASGDGELAGPQGIPQGGAAALTEPPVALPGSGPSVVDHVPGFIFTVTDGTEVLSETPIGLPGSDPSLIEDISGLNPSVQDGTTWEGGTARPRYTTHRHNATTESKIPGCSDDPFASACLSFPSISPTPNVTSRSTSSIITSDTLLTSSTSSCYTPGDDEPITEYSIIYTETITFYGNRTDYTAPYPTIPSQDYCPSMTTEFTASESTSRSTLVMFTTNKKTPTSCSDNTRETECLGPAVPIYETDTTNTRKVGGPSSRVTVTFITTDKNPSVVFPSDPVPRYSQPQRGPGQFSKIDHQSVPADKHGDGPQSIQKIAKSDYIVTAREDEVIINGKTYSDLKPGGTTTVTVDEGVFTIYPTAVVGEGATIGKPQPANTAISVATPTSATVGGIPVVVSGTQAVVDGTTLNIPPADTSTKVNDKPVAIGPGRVIVNGQTLTFRASGAQQTDVVVTGGEMVTAIGQSVYVYHSTTLTYGRGIPETREVVDDDTITIGPSGVVVHGVTMGGPSAEKTGTHYEIVGGATMTKVSPSLVIVEGTTFTVGPGATTTTKSMGGETIIIGPSGVTISSMTWTYPFGSSTVTTIKASSTGKAKGTGKAADKSTDESTDKVSGKATNKATGRVTGKVTDTNDFPTETKIAGQDDEGGDDSAGTSLQPGLVTGFTGLCIAIGVFVWI